jgi:hypothetical protein
MIPLPGIPGETMEGVTPKDWTKSSLLDMCVVIGYISVQINVSGKSLTHPNVAQQKVKPFVHEWENIRPSFHFRRPSKEDYNAECFLTERQKQHAQVQAY